MAQIYWTPKEPPSEETVHAGPNSLEVNEQHALPVGIFVRPFDGLEAEEVAGDNPLPVKLAPHKTVTIMLAPVAVSTTVVTLLAPANSYRRSIMITNETGTAVVRLMTSPGEDIRPPLTITNGQYLHSAAGSNITINGNNAVWGITVSVGAQTVSVTEDTETYL